MGTSVSPCFLVCDGTVLFPVLLLLIAQLSQAGAYTRSHFSST